MAKRKHVLIDGFKHIAYQQESFEADEMLSRSKSHFQWMDKRRSVRAFSDKPVAKAVIDNIIRTASTAPSGANKQPWTFCAVANRALKKKIRVAAEQEEVKTYSERMSEQWRKDLAPLGTDTNKPFIEDAPWIIVVFKLVYEYENRVKHQNYYVAESVGISCGMLISAIHHAGLVTLTHTPSPMDFLSKLLNRPENEKPFLLLPVGYAQDEVFVPDIKRKSLDEVVVYYE
jgi:iodotyrosine deiodinase